MSWSPPNREDGSTHRSPPPGTATILVVGHRGMLGQDLMRQLESNGLSPAGLDLPQIDITRFERVNECFGALQPRVVINCAAYTAVDRAETEAALAFAVNRDGAENLAAACYESGIPLLHISTDYVFDGHSTRPYREDDPPNPLGVYGLSKWEGEEAIRKTLQRHLIVRTAWMFGVHGPNFVKTMLRLAMEKDEVRVVADQRGCPTWTVDLADALVTMVQRMIEDTGTLPWGAYHFCGEGETSWHGFAEEIIREGGRHELLRTNRVVPIATPDYPTPARRPAYSVLDCRRIGEVFGIVPRSWRFGLAETVSQVCETKNA